MIYSFIYCYSMDYEIKYVGTTELTNIPYISVQLIRAIATASYQ